MQWWLEGNQRLVKPVNKKVKVDLRKKWKVLFQPNLRIITQEEHLRKLSALFHLLEVKAQ